MNIIDCYVQVLSQPSASQQKHPLASGKPVSTLNNTSTTPLLHSNIARPLSWTAAASPCAGSCEEAPIIMMISTIQLYSPNPLKSMIGYNNGYESRNMRTMTTGLGTSECIDEQFDHCTKEAQGVVMRAKTKATNCPFLILGQREEEGVLQKLEKVL